MAKFYFFFSVWLSKFLISLEFILTLTAGVEVVIFFITLSLSILDAFYFVVLISAVGASTAFPIDILLSTLSLIDSGVGVGLLIYFSSILFCTVLFSFWAVFGGTTTMISGADVAASAKMGIGTGYILFTFLLKFSEILDYKGEIFFYPEGVRLLSSFWSEFIPFYG